MTLEDSKIAAAKLFGVPFDRTGKTGIWDIADKDAYPFYFVMGPHGLESRNNSGLGTFSRGMVNGDIISNAGFTYSWIGPTILADAAKKVPENQTHQTQKMVLIIGAIIAVFLVYKAG